MLRENLKDSGEIIQNILTQPLSLPGVGKEVSLLEAAKSYDARTARSSDLYKIMLSFLQFPEPTEMMIRELELLQEDLEVS